MVWYVNFWDDRPAVVSKWESVLHGLRSSEYILETSDMFIIANYPILIRHACTISKCDSNVGSEAYHEGCLIYLGVKGPYNIQTDYQFH